MGKAQLYYDSLSESEKRCLANEYLSGPQPAFEGVHLQATDQERLNIGRKRFNDKFNRDPFDCPHNHFIEGIDYDSRPIAQRLSDESYL